MTHETLLLLRQDVAELVVHGMEEPVVHVDGLHLMALIGVAGIDTRIVNIELVDTVEHDLQTTLSRTENLRTVAIPLIGTGKLDDTGHVGLHELRADSL